MTVLIPNSELVAVAWLKAALGLTDNVATLLPVPSSWTSDEFVQVTQLAGSSDRDLMVSEAVVGVNCYAKKDGSAKPPWGQANQLAMGIWRATFVRRWQPDPAVELVMPRNYGRAVVRTVQALSTPKRVPADPSQYAVYSLDLQFSWIPASEVIT